MKGLLCKDWAILVNSYKKNFLILVLLYLVWQSACIWITCVMRWLPCAAFTHPAP